MFTNHTSVSLKIVIVYLLFHANEVHSGEGPIDEFLNNSFYGFTNERPMLVVNTWNFTHANSIAWKQLLYGHSALDAIEEGCHQCEIDRCDGAVGWGGSPDENGETTLDALIMDGMTYDAGAVAGIRRIKAAISVARRVMENTNHTLLVGDMATQFAVSLGYKQEDLTSKESYRMWMNWSKNNCQPNYWRNVKPDPRDLCGPYKPIISDQHEYEISHNYLTNELDSSQSLGHDTIGMVAIDSKGRVAAGTSTNGLKFKIPGRVGDSPIPGAGAYADGDVGGAAATGDGDVMMRFLISYQAVENLRQGMTPSKAANDVIRRMMRKVGPPYPEAAVIVVSSDGSHGAACSGFKEFPHVVSSSSAGHSQSIVTKCFTS